jgi:hypothetical protein
VRMRVRGEEAVAALAGVLAPVTAVWRDWIEVVFRVDPDHHSGATEWVIVAALALLSLAAWLASRVERRRVRGSGEDRRVRGGRPRAVPVPNPSAKSP